MTLSLKSSTIDGSTESAIFHNQWRLERGLGVRNLKNFNVFLKSITPTMSVSTDFTITPTVVTWSLTSRARVLFVSLAIQILVSYEVRGGEGPAMVWLEGRKPIAAPNNFFL